MSLRPPSQFSASAAGTVNPLDHEIMAEKAASLGRAGEQAEASLVRLRAHDGIAEGREELVRLAARAVYGYFIQRELCGLRRHDGVIRDLSIPREVLARLGAT